VTVCPGVSADFNHDCDVDVDDFDEFEPCASGPAVPYAGSCAKADLDGDDDVDADDFGIFQRCYSGANQQADPSCAN
jgi:hypothetical protein